MALLGNMFWLASGKADLEHLYVVISDPLKNPNEVVLVSLTTRDHGVDESCVVSEGDHPHIDHESCIDYSRAEILSEAAIDNAVANERVRPVEDASPQLLCAIWRGAEETKHLPHRCDSILSRQGLIA